MVAADGNRYSIPGDFATVEDDGRITLLGRGSVCINTGGEKVYPEEVESVLKAHPDVFDVIVVGAPDERWGQRVSAIVEVRPGHELDLEDLDRHARGPPRRLQGPPLRAAGRPGPALAQRQARLPLGPRPRRPPDLTPLLESTHLLP